MRGEQPWTGGGRFEHAEEIKAAEGLSDFAALGDEFEELVAARSYMTGDGARAIFADAVDWLRERRVLLPGVTTLARLVARAQAESYRRLWATLAALPSESELVQLVRRGRRIGGHHGYCSAMLPRPACRVTTAVAFASRLCWVLSTGCSALSVGLAAQVVAGHAGLRPLVGCTLLRPGISGQR